MKTIVYIDGFNLQYGLLRDPSMRWLDLEKLVRSLLTPKYEVVTVGANNIHRPSAWTSAPTA